MEKAGNIESGTLEHFSSYKYAPTRPAPINVFAITGAALVGMNSNPGTAAAAAGARANSSGMVTFRPPRNINSTDSEKTSVTYLSSQSGLNSRDSPTGTADSFQLPRAE